MRWLMCREHRIPPLNVMYTRIHHSKMYNYRNSLQTSRRNVVENDDVVDCPVPRDPFVQALGNDLES